MTKRRARLRTGTVAGKCAKGKVEFSPFRSDDEEQSGKKCVRACVCDTFSSLRRRRRRRCVRVKSAKQQQQAEEEEGKKTPKIRVGRVRVKFFLLFRGTSPEPPVHGVVCWVVVVDLVWPAARVVVRPECCSV